jgi:hypothetical protein
MARPTKKIDLVELEKLYGMQCTDREVAAYMGISVKTLERRKKIQKFADVMDGAKAKGRVSVRRMLFIQGAKGNIAAAIFLAKNVLGYKDYVSNEHSGPDGGPISIGPAPELGELTEDELKQLAVLVSKTSPPRKG